MVSFAVVALVDAASIHDPLWIRLAVGAAIALAIAASGCVIFRIFGKNGRLIADAA